MLPIVLSVVLSVVTAVVVTVGAAFTVVSYVHARSTENQRWRRDNVLEAAESHLNGSFMRYSQRSYNVWMRGETSKLKSYVDRALEGTHQQNMAMTRLRLLAPEGVVVAAEALQEADRGVTAVPEQNPQQEPGTWRALNSGRDELRVRLLTAYRRAYRIEDAVPIARRDAVTEV